MNIRKGRIVFLVCVAVFGYTQQGISGAFWCLFAFCLACFVYYTVMDGVISIGNFFRRPTNVFINLPDEKPGPEHPDIEGTVTRRHPDPTRPTDEDDFAGLITYRVAKRDHKN